MVKAAQCFELDTLPCAKDTARRRADAGSSAVRVAVTIHTIMTYIRDLGRELDERLQAIEEVWREGDGTQCDAARAAFIKFVKERVLESYGNGLNAVSLRVEKTAKKLERSVRAK